MANFGKTIDLVEAAPMYQSVIEIRLRTHDKIKEALKDDDEALRYYLGRETVFFFDRNLVDYMLELIGPDKKDTGKGVAVYTGAKYDTERNVNGRPVIMVFPYNTIIENGKEKIVIINSGGNEVQKTGGPGAAVTFADGGGGGKEHPGGGGGGGGTTALKASQQAGIPVSFWVDEIQP